MQQTSHCSWFIARQTSIAAFAYRLAFLLAGSLVPCAAQAQTYSWNTTSGTWDTTTANWAGDGSTWTNSSSNNAVFAYSTTSGTVTVDGSITSGTIFVGNSSNNGNYTFTNGTSGSISAAAFIANSAVGSKFSTTLQNLALTTSGNLLVGRDASMVIGGSSTLLVDGTIGGQLGPIADASWGVLTIQDSAVVTATGGVNGNAEAWSLNLNGGTLYTPSIQASDREGGGDARLTFNGTRVVATTSTSAFVTVGANYLATNSALVNSGGAIFDTNGFDVGVAINLKNGVSSGSLTKLGAGTLTLSGTTSDYSGGTTINAGTLVMGSGSALGAAGSNLTVNGGTLDLRGQSLTVGLLTGSSGGLITSNTAGSIIITASSASSGVFAGSLTNGSGMLGLTKSGAGTLSLTGSNSYTGGTVVNAGVLSVASSDALPGWNASGEVTVNSGGQVAVGNAFSDADVTTMLSTGSNFRAGSSIGFDTSAGNRTYAANLGDTAQGPLGLVKAGANTLVVSGSNSHTGGTTITAGTLQVGNISAIGPASGSITLNGGTLDLNGYSVTAGLLSGGTAGTISTSSAAGSTLTVGSSGSSIYAGVIANGSGTVGIVKQNAGVLTLSNTASTYSGVTTINGGTLDVARLASGGANSSIGAASNAAANLVINGGVLRYTGATAQSTDRLVTVGLNGATFDSSGSATVVFSNMGSVAFAGSANRTITFAGTYGAGNNQFGALIANSGGTTSVLKTGTGTWLLGVNNGPNNTYTGSTTILAGTLIGGAWNNQQGFGNTSAIYLGDTSGTNNATVQFGTGVATAFTSVPIVVQSGNTGTATIVNFTNNSIQGSVTLGSANSSGKSVVIRNIGDFRWTPNFNNVIQDPTGLVAGTAGTVIFDNADTAGDSANWRINAANTFTGDTRLLSGSLTVSNANAFQNSTLDLGFAGDTGAVVWNQTSTLGGLKGTRNLDTTGRVLSIGNNNQTTSYSGVLSGSGGLTKIGTGMLTLSGSNTFTGATTVSAGTLSVGHAAALGASGGNLIASGGVLDLGGFGINRSGTVSFTGGTVRSGTLTNDTVAFDGQAGTVSAALAGAAGLTKSGAGTLSLTGLNSYAGGTVVNAGVLAVASKDGLPGWNVADKLTVNSGGGVAVGADFADADVATMIATGSNFRAGAAIGFDTTAGDRTYTANFANSPQGALGLTKSGVNTLTMSGSNSYTGPTRINAGTVAFTHADNQTLSGTISGPGSLAKSGTGTLTLSAAPTLTGTVTISAGRLALPAMNSGIPFTSIIDSGTLDTSNGGSWGGNTVTFGQNGGTLQWGAANWFGAGTMNVISTAGAPTSQMIGTTYLNLGGATVNFTANGDINLNAPLANAGSIIKGGTGTLIVSANAHGGGTQPYNVFVDAGTLRASANDALAGTGAITFRGGTLQYNAASPSDWSSRIRNSGSAIAVDTNGRSITWSGTINSTNTGGLRKLGSGTLSLSGSNAYSGGTWIDAGTLIVNGGLAGDVVVASGATLGGSGQLGDILSGAGTISVGNSPGIGTAGSVDPSLGTDWVFEITGTAPTWNAGTSASVNDVLRLTDATPFVSNLTSSNIVDVLFNLGATPIAQGDYLGGFFVDNMSTSELTTALAGGQFRYWVLGEFGTAGDQQTFNVGSGGVPITYSLLSAYDSSLGASYTVTEQTGNFGSADVSGVVTQFMIVPEPSTVIFAGIGIAMAGWCLRKRRRIAHILNK